MRFTLKSLSPALTTSPASSVGLPASLRNSSLTQSVSMVDALTQTSNREKAIDEMNVLERNILVEKFCVSRFSEFFHFCRFTTPL
jgi:hypothetical protein